MKPRFNPVLCCLSGPPMLSSNVAPDSVPAIWQLRLLKTGGTVPAAGIRAVIPRRITACSFRCHPLVPARSGAPRRVKSCWQRPIRADGSGARFPRCYIPRILLTALGSMFSPRRSQREVVQRTWRDVLVRLTYTARAHNGSLGYQIITCHPFDSTQRRESGARVRHHVPRSYRAKRGSHRCLGIHPRSVAGTRRDREFVMAPRARVPRPQSGVYATRYLPVYTSH